MGNRHGTPLNKPVEHDPRTYVTPLTVWGGGLDFFLTPDELAAYNADPDQWVAVALGVSVDEYRDWIETQGTPRCGARVKSGRLCRNTVGEIQLSIERWARLDREVFCHAHAEPSDEAGGGAR